MCSSMEDQLRIAVDQLGDPAGHGTPGERVFQAIERASTLVADTPETVLAECRSTIPWVYPTPDSFTNASTSVSQVVDGREPMDT